MSSSRIIIFPTQNGRYQFQVILSTFLMEKWKKLWLILEPDYRFGCISDIFLATDLDQIFRVILVLPKPDLDPFKWENLQVGELWYILDTHPPWISHWRMASRKNILSNHSYMRTFVFWGLKWEIKTLKLSIFLVDNIFKNMFNRIGHFKAKCYHYRCKIVVLYS